MKIVPVHFEGQKLAFIRFDHGEGALAFPHQVTDSGIKLECLLEPGFAHIDSDGQIWRLGDCSGNANDHPDLAALWSLL